MTMTSEIVMPTIAVASPAALRIGRMLGAGMWICSPTGGASTISSCSAAIAYAL